MSGVILNVTDLNSSENHLHNRQNDGIGIGAVDERATVRNVDEKQRNETKINDAIDTVNINDINSNGSIANELSYIKTADADAAAAPASSSSSSTTITDSSSQHRRSTAESLGSNSRSISLDHHNHGYDDSSAFDSNSEADSDFEDIVPSPQPSNSINLNKSSSSSVVMMDRNLDGRQSSILCGATNDTTPNIGSIAVQNSSDITFGNKTFYQGPVTIKQFVYDKNKWRETEFPEGTPENDNLGFVNSSTDKLSRMKIGEQNELEKKWRCTSRQSLYAATIAGILACSLLALIVIVKYSNSDQNSTVLHIGDGDDSRLNEPIKSDIGDIISDTAGPLRVISRKEWIAQPPNNKLERLELPVGRVIIAHTATENCTTQADCTFQVRTIQTFHIESRGWDDIGYNFLVGGDGAIYVGRGWEDMGAHTKGYNFGSICFAFIGTFNTVVPPKRQLVAVQKMMQEGIKLEKLTADYKLYGHRQFFGTQSPGTALYNIIKTWDHWNDTVGPPNP